MRIGILFCGILFCVSFFCGSAHSAQADKYGLDAIERAIHDLSKSFPDEYKDGAKYLAELEALRNRIKDGKNLKQIDSAVNDLKQRSLMANPLLDFDDLLLIRRSDRDLGLPSNWVANSAIRKKGFDNEIGLLSFKNKDAKIRTLYKPDRDIFVGDIKLHFDADKMLFSMLDDKNDWQVWEMGVDGKGLKQVTFGEDFSYDNYDGCYLPDGRVIFASTRMSHGVPCVGGNSEVANLFLLDRKTNAVRQLCYDQDQNWSPTVINNGRVMFTRWEYSDSAHYFSRIVMTMNPDGTDQKAYYGSNSYWPNSLFYARPIPNHPTKFIGIVSGHHGVKRMGELVLFDPAISRFEADGVVQRIPGYGEKVEPVIVDKLVDKVWPKFLHPYPLSDKYFLVSAQLTPRSRWGVYLVDIFDNMTLIKEMEGNVLFEPVPLRKTKTPPVIVDRINLDRNDSTVMITDVYEGPGLADVPRGTIKKLRIYELYYAFMKMGGHKQVAVEGCWDIRRILGTVDVNEDGSASFKVPANTPHAIQCLDADGSAVQMMRSWYTTMPGETVSCVGCHEDQNMTPPNKRTEAARKAPPKVTPWYGPTRGFSFNREVQPVLDKYCVGCHNGKKSSRPNFAAKKKNGWNNFPEPYLALHPYVRRPGPESDIHLPNPYEYNANTSELVQILRKGHYGVKMDDEAWDRIITWIDLNVPAHGTWSEQKRVDGDQFDMRLKMRSIYADRAEDPEKIYETIPGPVKFVKPAKPVKPKPIDTSCEDWPFDAKQAKRLQKQSTTKTSRSIDLGNGVKIKLVHIPAGQFIMGSTDGALDEMPASQVSIKEPFWMAATEITSEQFNRFDASHHNGYFNQQHKDHTTPGYIADKDNHPVIRVSWKEANAFCQWLSKETGLEVSLPTEAQWEWACRAGSDSSLNFGEIESDFGQYANLADSMLSLMAVKGVNPRPIKNPSQYDAFIPRITTVDDGSTLMNTVAQYKPNVWGLYDMHGNVAEWTRSDFVGYPYSDADGRNNFTDSIDKVARGGSWRDRPMRATSTYRLGYRPHQKVYNVGFRVIVKDRGNLRANSDSGQKKTFQRDLMDKYGRCILMGGCGLGKVILQAEDQSLIWQMNEKRDSLDVWMLENGDIVYSTKDGISKIRPDYQSGRGGELIWEVKAPKGYENYTSQPIGDDLYLVGYSSNEGSYVAEIDSSGKVHKRIEVQGQASKHRSFRQVRKTEAGTYLTTQQAKGGQSKEYSADGKLLRTFPSGRFSAERLKNGNTLIGCGDEHRLIEVDAHNNVVWEVKQDDIEGVKLGFVAGVWPMNNGNIMISNWGGHGGEPGAAIIEIDRNKNLISSTEDSVNNKVASLFVIEKES